MASLNAVLKLFNTFSGKLTTVTKKAEKLANIFQKDFAPIDQFTNLNAKLGLITSNLKEQAELQEKIFAAANRSRSTYSDMVNSIAKIKASTGDLFKSNEESIAFTELIKKSMIISGTDVNEQPKVMQQVTDSMVNGNMSSTGFLAIKNAAPSILEAVSGYTGKSIDELFIMAEKGELTSEILKNSMLFMMQEIETQFNDMPLTFDGVWRRISNAGTEAFSGLMNDVASLLNNPIIIDIINGIINSIYYLAEGINYLVSLITQYWPYIQSVLYAIGMLISFFVIKYLMAAIPVLINFIAWWFVANLPIIAIILTLAAFIYMLISLGVTVEDIFGFIGGVIGTVIAFILNLLILVWNAIADLVNFLANAFNHPLSSILILFNDWTISILDFFISIVQGLETLINKVTGSKLDLTSGIMNLRNKVEESINLWKNDVGWQEFAPKLDYVNYEDFAGIGDGLGRDLYNNLKGLTEPKLDPEKEYDFDINKYDPNNSNNSNGSTGSSDTSNPYDTNNSYNFYDTVPIEGTGPNGSVNVEMPDDDLDYLRDIAERDYIANVATNSLAPNISIQFGDVHENADANKVAGRIREILQNEIAVASEGGY